MSTRYGVVTPFTLRLVAALTSGKPNMYCVNRENKKNFLLEEVKRKCKASTSNN